MSEKRWSDPERAKGLVLVLKHSPICGVSASALHAARAFAAAHPDVPLQVIDVIRERPESDRLAESLGVRHASPQAILLSDGAPVWNDSHFGISRGSLEGAVTRARAAGGPA